MIKLCWAAGILSALHFAAHAMDLPPKSDRLPITVKTCYAEVSTLAEFLVPDLNHGIKFSSKSRIKYIVKNNVEGSPE
jgi:hypothetical protein